MKATACCKKSRRGLFIGRGVFTVGTLTLRFKAFAQLRLGFSVGSESSLGVELVGHGGGGDHGLEAARPLGHILLGVEKHHVDLRHIEQPEGHGGAQAHGDGQRGRLDVHLQEARGHTHSTALYLALGCEVSVCG